MWIYADADLCKSPYTLVVMKYIVWIFFVKKCILLVNNPNTFIIFAY